MLAVAAISEHRGGQAEQALQLLSAGKPRWNLPAGAS